MEINYDRAKEYFNRAIEVGFFNEDISSDMYVGIWMYMYSKGNKHFFKNKQMKNYTCFEDIIEFANAL